jgi:hypothetical protein
MELYGTMTVKTIYEMREYGKTLTANEIVMHWIIDDADATKAT